MILRDVFGYRKTYPEAAFLFVAGGVGTVKTVEKFVEFGFFRLLASVGLFDYYAVFRLFKRNAYRCVPRRIFDGVFDENAQKPAHGVLVAKIVKAVGREETKLSAGSRRVIRK